MANLNEPVECDFCGKDTRDINICFCSADCKAGYEKIRGRLKAAPKPRVEAQYQPLMNNLYNGQALAAPQYSYRFDPLNGWYISQ